jgi:hypothetical protein
LPEPSTDWWPQATSPSPTSVPKPASPAPATWSGFSRTQELIYELDRINIPGSGFHKLIFFKNKRTLCVIDK